MKKTVLRLFSVFLALILTMSVFPLAFYAFAAEENYTYTVLENGIKITGCSSSETEIVIPESIDGYDVVAIGEKAFSSCNNTKKIVVPDFVTSVDLYAFKNCKSLESVQFPTKAINGNYNGLTDAASSVTVGDATTVMNFSRSTDDNFLTEITIDSKFESLDFLMKLRAYFGYISNITVDEGNTAFEVVDGVLYDEAVETLILYPSGSNKKEYVMPSTVKKYNEDLEYDINSTCGAISLKKITLSRDFLKDSFDEYYSQGYNTYLDVSEEYADYFGKCMVSHSVFRPIFSLTLKSIGVEQGNAYFSSSEGVLYDKEGSFLYYHPTNGVKNIVFPAEVAQTAFNYTEGMNVTLSDEYINTAYRFQKQQIISYVKEPALSSEEFSDFLKTEKMLSDDEILSVSDDDFLNYYYEFTFIKTGEDISNILDVELYSFIISALRPFSAVSYTVPETNEYLCTVDGAIFNKDKSVFIKSPLEGKAPIIELPDTVKDFAVMDGMYFNFSTDAYPSYRDDLIVHTSPEQLNYLIDSEKIYLMRGVTNICVDEITEKFEKYNEELRNSLAPQIAEIETKINELNQEYESGNLTEYDYKTLVRYYERQIKFPEVVECTRHSDKFDVMATPENGCFDTEVSISVSEVERNSDVFYQFAVYTTGNGSIEEIYSICFEDSEGNVVQPKEGKKVTVRIKNPDTSIPIEKYKILHLSSPDDAPDIISKSQIRHENGYLVFEVDHFSYFAVFVETDEPEVPDISTEKTVSSVAISALPSKASYTYKMDSLDLSGLALTVTYSDGTTETVTDTAKMNVTGFDNSKTGEQNITVEYEGFTAQFNVTVKYAWWQWIIRILLLGFLWY